MGSEMCIRDRIRAVQGASVEFVQTWRTAIELRPETVEYLPCLCHGTTWGGFHGIMQGCHKPGGGTARAATRGEATLDLRNDIMMSPYPYWDKDNYVSGMRKTSPLYMFYDLEMVAGIEAVKLHLTVRGSVVTPNEIPWHVVDCCVAKGNDKQGAEDVIVFHHIARTCGNPVGITDASLRRYKSYLRSGRRLDPTFVTNAY